MANIWFITGTSRGLGRAITVAALESGDCVIATARKSEMLMDLVGRYGDRILPLALDVTDNPTVVKAVQVGYEHFGRVDVVVNNAGYGDIAAVEDIKLENFRAQMETNFFGVVNVTKAVLPVLRRQGSGHIFQVSSVGGRVGTVGLAAYQSAKWAVGGFSVILAQEVAPLGIQVTVLEPGGIRTDWAGSSMTIPPISEPYAETVGKFAAFLRGHSGTEPSDPSKIAGIIRGLVGRKDAPVRLLLGPDAVAYAGQAAEALAASDRTWRDLSLSSAF